MQYFRNLFQGRINRKNYLVGYLFLWILVLPMIVAMSKIPIMLVAAMVPILIMYARSFDQRRSNDLGFSGLWWGKTSWDIFWMFRSGEDKENKYGKPPKPQLDIKNLLGFKSSRE